MFPHFHDYKFQHVFQDFCNKKILPNLAKGDRSDNEGKRRHYYSRLKT